MGIKQLLTATKSFNHGNKPFMPTLQGYLFHTFYCVQAFPWINIPNYYKNMYVRIMMVQHNYFVLKLYTFIAYCVMYVFKNKIKNKITNQKKKERITLMLWHRVSSTLTWQRIHLHGPAVQEDLKDRVEGGVQVPDSGKLTTAVLGGVWV
jgi:hypothetical protein